MADVINTSTLELRASVNEVAPPYDAPPWLVISRAQFDLWGAIPRQYRKWVGDHVEEMSQPEKDAVDAAAQAAQLDDIVQQVDKQGELLRAFMLMVLDEFNLHAARIKAILDAIDAGASLASIKSAVASIADPPTRTAQQLRAALRAKLAE